MAEPSPLQIVDELEHLLAHGDKDGKKFHQKCRQSLPQLAQILKADAKDPTPQKRCLTLIKEHCAGSEPNALNFIATEAFPAVFVTLKAHYANAAITLEALGLLADLAVHGGTRQRLAQKNAVSYAVQVMQKMGDQEEVQRVGMLFLRNLARDSPEGQKEIAARGGVELLFFAANHHQQNAQIAELFLANLFAVSHCYDGCKGIVEQGGIHLLLQLVSHPSGYPAELVENAMGALVNLAAIAEAQGALVSEGCIPVLTSLLQATGDGGQQLSLGAMQIVSRLARNTELLELVQHGALGSVITALAKGDVAVPFARVATAAVNSLIADPRAQEQVVFTDRKSVV